VETLLAKVDTAEQLAWLMIDNCTKDDLRNTANERMTVLMAACLQGYT
jgi:hypothetical protein